MPLPFQTIQHIPGTQSGETGSTPVVGSSKNKTSGRWIKGATQSQLLLHTTGQLPRPPMLERLYLTIDIPYQIVVLLDRRIEDRSEEVQVLLYRQVLVEREAAGHISYPPTDLLQSLSPRPSRRQRRYRYRPATTWSGYGTGVVFSRPIRTD